MTHIDLVKTTFWLCGGFVMVSGSFVIIKKSAVFFLKTLVPTRQEVKDLEAELDDKISLKTDEKEYVIHKSHCSVSFDDLKNGQDLIHHDIQAIRTLMDRLIDNLITRNLK